MPDGTLDLADRLWRGEVSSSEYHPVSLGGGLAEICDGVAFVPSFANVSAFVTDDGLVLVDTGSSFAGAAVHSELRRWTGQRLNTAVYSHGHIDHVFGLPAWEAEAADRGWPAPAVVAHEAVARRPGRPRDRGGQAPGVLGPRGRRDLNDGQGSLPLGRRLTAREISRRRRRSTAPRACRAPARASSARRGGRGQGGSGAPHPRR